MKRFRKHVFRVSKIQGNEICGARTGHEINKKIRKKF